MRPLCGPGDAACHTTCPPGWEFDSLLFYLSSCNSPAGLFVGVTSVALVLCIAACALSLLRFVTAKGATKRVILYFGLSALCLVVAFSEALARGFMDNYFWVPFGGFMIFIGAGYLQFLSLFFKVCYSQIGQKMSAQKHVIMRSLLWCSGLSLALPIGIVFPSYFLSLGPWSSPQFPVNEYNLAVCVLFISVPIHLLAAFPCGLVVTSDLESHIRSAANVPNQSDSRKLREVHRRVWLFRVLNVGLFSFSETFFCDFLFPFAYFLPAARILLPWLCSILLCFCPIALIAQVFLLTSSRAMPEASKNASSPQVADPSNENEAANRRCPLCTV